MNKVQANISLDLEVSFQQKDYSHRDLAVFLEYDVCLLYIGLEKETKYWLSKILSLFSNIFLIRIYLLLHAFESVFEGGLLSLWLKYLQNVNFECSNRFFWCRRTLSTFIRFGSSFYSPQVYHDFQLQFSWWKIANYSLYARNWLFSNEWIKW